MPVVVGVALAAAPFAIFEYWLGATVEQQGQRESETSAARAIVTMEAGLDRVVATLNDLVERGVGSCTPSDIETMRRATFATGPLKELSVVSIDGTTMCTDLGLSLGPREVVGKPQRSKRDETVLEVVYFADTRQNMVRLRRVLEHGDSVAGLISQESFIPVSSTQASGSAPYVRVDTTDGIPIVEADAFVVAGTPPSEIFSATHESDRFGLRVTVSRTRAQMLASHSDLRTNGLIFCGATSLILVGLLVTFIERRRQNPYQKMAAALAAGEFVPYYQPIVDITTGRLIGAEVLARWQKPDGTLIPPAVFIPMMEQNGLILKLSGHLMRRAAIDLVDSYGRCPHLRVSFNLTAAQFEDERTAAEVRSIFARTPIRLTQVVLELTERQEPRDFAKTRQVVASFQVLGCKVALDDVGTGHSGLSSILKLGVDIIKIDKVFVDSMDDDRNSGAIIATLVELARKLGMDTVAEGVEHVEQVAELRRRGIRAAQGFVVSPPLPAQAYIRLVDALNPPQEAGGAISEDTPAAAVAAAA